MLILLLYALTVLYSQASKAILDLRGRETQREGERLPVLRGGVSGGWSARSDIWKAAECSAGAFLFEEGV